MKNFFLNSVLCGILLTIFSGCSSIVNSHTQKEGMMIAYLAGNDQEVSKELSSKLSGSWTSAAGSGDELMWRLEAGGFYLITGKDKESFQEFKKAQALIEDYDKRAIINMRQAVSEGTMLMTNPCVLPYQGLCRDRILFPVYKALACLGMKDEAGFRVELFHLRETQDRVISEYRKYFEEEQKSLQEEKEKNKEAAKNADIDKVLGDSGNKDLSKALDQTGNVASRGYGNFLNPFTVFMSGYGYLRDDSIQNAVVDFDRLYKAMPAHPLVQKYLVTVRRMSGHEIPSALRNVAPFDFPLGHDNILVIFANGRSAAFRQYSLYIPVFYAGYITMATVAWQMCEYYDKSFPSMKVLSGKKEYVTLPIADMDGILAQEYMSRLPGMLTRIILSTAAKEISSYIAIEAARHTNEGAGLAVALTTAAYKAVFNTADTRSWEMLPKEYQIVQLPFPQDRTLTLSLPGLNPRKISFSRKARSAIIFVNAPSGSSAAVSCRVFELQTK